MSNTLDAVWRAGTGTQHRHPPNQAGQPDSLPGSQTVGPTAPFEDRSLDPGADVKRPAGLGVRFPQPEDRSLAQIVFRMQTNNRGDAMASVRVLHHVHRSGDLHTHTDLEWSSGDVLRLRQDR